MSSIADDYATNGFAIARRVFDPGIITEFHDAYRAFISNPPTSISNMAEQKLSTLKTVDGIHVDPIGDPLMLDFVPSFVDAVRAMLLGPTIDRLVRTVAGIDGPEPLICVMSMLFGRKSGTPGHQDAYYLSSLPPGRIHATWVALEDIRAASGKFWVLKEKPPRRLMDLSESETGSADAYEAHVKEYVEKQVAAGNAEIFAPDLDAGDVLVWNVNTVHGSFKSADDQTSSRLSFTAHYLSSRDDFVINAYRPTVRKIEFAPIDYPVKCRITTAYRAKEAGAKPNFRSSENFGRLDPNPKT